MKWEPDGRHGPERRVYCIAYSRERSDPPPVATIATLTITVGYSGPRVSYLLHAGREILARRPWIETADHDARRDAVRALMQEGESWHANQVEAALAKRNR